MFKRSLWIVVLLLSGPIGLSAQSETPVISGGLQFLSTSQGGATFFQPLIAPVVTIPLGDHWLIESRATFDEFIGREDGATGPWHAQTLSSIDYLQLDYVANSHLTVVVGDFLTPFNIYIERISPVWIQNFQDAPIIATIGTRPAGSSDGAMLRGVLLSQKNWELNYVAYFSTLVNAKQFDSGRSVGGRVGVSIPKTRLEVGMSYQRLLQDEHLNSFGAYLVWEPFRVPLRVQGEYAHAPGGQGYWLEGDYRFSQILGSNRWLANLQALARVQQFHAGTPTLNDEIPTLNTQQVDFGFNYYLPHNLRLNATYGRQFSGQGPTNFNANIWNVQLTYRFLFPLLPGGSK